MVLCIKKNTRQVYGDEMVEKLRGGFLSSFGSVSEWTPSNRELRAWDGLSVRSHVLGLWLYAWLSACHVCWLPVQQLGSFRKKVRNPVSFEIAAGNIPLEPAGRDFVTWRCLLGQGPPRTGFPGWGALTCPWLLFFCLFWVWSYQRSHCVTEVGLELAIF